MKRKVTYVLACLTALFVAVPQVARAQDARALRGLDDYITRAMTAWDVPALSIAVVRNDSVLLVKGYGTLGKGRAERVNENTLFGIGSLTKAFTSTAAAMLVSEGRLGWDDKVVDRLDGFRLYEPYTTAHVTMRDILAHRTGLARGDRMWYDRTLDREAVVRRVRYSPPDWSFREHYVYSNTMYTAAGLVEGAVAGESWDDFVTERIFRPLGMRRSNTSVRAEAGDPNVVVPYTYVRGKSIEIPVWNQDNIGPAGSINSTATDLAQWLRFQLSDGSYAGRRLVSARAFRETHTPQIVLPLSSGSPSFTAYAMGWNVGDFRGNRILAHSGGGHGVASRIAMLPDRHMAVAVLSNSDGAALSTGIAYRVLDLLLGGEVTDWSRNMLASRDAAIARSVANERALAEKRVKDAPPALPLDAYVGEYFDPYYGVAEVTKRGDHLYLRFVGEIAGPLEHWQYETFLAHWEHPRYGSNFVTFTLDDGGNVSSIRIPPEADTSRFVEFHRKSNGERSP
jgi:CubicO group peptidase (beta-lactamase class C family)